MNGIIIALTLLVSSGRTGTIYHCQALGCTDSPPRVERGVSGPIVPLTPSHGR